MLSGDIITGDSDEPDVAGDHGPWNTRLGRGFLQPGNVSSQTVVVNMVYHAHLHTHIWPSGFPSFFASPSVLFNIIPCL